MKGVSFGELSLRQRVIGAVSCYAALVALAASELLGATAIVCVGIGALMTDRHLAPAAEAGVVASAPRWPLGFTALVAVPLASNLLVIPLLLARAGTTDAIPLEGGVPVTALAATGAGVAAVRHGAPATSHGWWALAGGTVSVTLFGVLLAVLSS